MKKQLVGYKYKVYMVPSPSLIVHDIYCVQGQAYYGLGMYGEGHFRKYDTPGHMAWGINAHVHYYYYVRGVML